MGPEFARFVAVGGFAALVNLASRAALSLALPYEAAVALAYLVGMTTAFLLARRHVFAHSGRRAREEYLRFALVNAVALVQVWLVSVGLLRFGLPAIGWTWQAELVAHAAGVASPIVTSYLGHRHFTFRRAAPPDGPTAR